MTWLYAPYACSTGTEVSNSVSDPWHGYEPWLVLSGTPTRRPYSWNGWKKRGWIRLLSGMTCSRSTVDRGVAEWISSLPVSPVNHSPAPADRQGLTMIVGSGRKSPGYSTRYDPATSSWRTSEDLFEQVSPKSSQTLPVSGSMRNGVCSARPPLAPLTSVNGFGLWGTPVARDDQKSPEAHLAMKDRMGGGRTEPTSLTVQAKLWPTPRAMDAKGDVYQMSGTIRYESLTGLGRQTMDEVRRLWPTPTSSLGDSRRGMPSPAVATLRESQGKRNLDDAAVLWPTPTAADSERTSETMTRGNPTLLGAGRQWPTPNARDHKGVAQPGREGGDALPTAVKQWPTPRASDGTRRSDKAHGTGGPSLKVAAGHGLLAETTLPDGTTGSPRADLNPSFVASLMGLPPDWLTHSISEATVSSPSAPQSHGCSSQHA